MALECKQNIHIVIKVYVVVPGWWGCDISFSSLAALGVSGVRESRERVRRRVCRGCSCSACTERNRSRAGACD